MFGLQESPEQWLRRVEAQLGAGAGAHVPGLAGEPPGGASTFRFLDSMPEEVRETLGEFLTAEGISSDALLFQALKSDGKDGPPLLLQHARSELRAGPYTILRSACEAAGGLKEPAATPQAGQHPGPQLHHPVKPLGADDLPDFDRLQELLAEANLGSPLARALPAKSMTDECAIAASHHGVPDTKEIESVSGERPLAEAFLYRIRYGWAELLTGGACVADVLNVLFLMAQTALDKRQPADVAARAAVRHAATIRHEAFLEALQHQASGHAVESFGAFLARKNADIADRLLEEEGKKKGDKG